MPPRTAVRLAASDLNRQAGSRRAATEVATSLQDFGVELFGDLATEPGNLVMSPYSVAVALAMTRAGARGRTADEMDRVLHAGPDYHAGLNWLDRALESRATAKPDDDESKTTIALGHRGRSPSRKARPAGSSSARRPETASRST